jgi:hypothetical protein
MLSVPLLLLLLLAGGIAWVVLQGMRARELALVSSRHHCRRLGLQLLDETVQQDGLKLLRDSEGRWRVWRRYGFEYTADGERRERGSVITHGQRIVVVEIDGEAVLH